MRNPTRRSSQGCCTKCRLRMGSVAPIKVVGRMSRPAEATNRRNDKSA